jgi:hypothetical protein
MARWRISAPGYAVIQSDYASDDAGKLGGKVYLTFKAESVETAGDFAAD